MSCWAMQQAMQQSTRLLLTRLFPSALMSHQGLLNCEVPQLTTDKEAYDTDLHSRVPLACHRPSGPLP